METIVETFTCIICYQRFTADIPDDNARVFLHCSVCFSYLELIRDDHYLVLRSHRYMKSLIAPECVQ